MWIQKQLEQEINTRLYQSTLNINQEIKLYLPFKDIPLSKCEELVRCLDKEISLLVQDYIQVRQNNKFYLKEKKFNLSLNSQFSLSLLNSKEKYEKKLRNFFKKVSDTTKEVIEILEQYDKQSCVVGGCIRDILHCKDIVPKDFDFVSALDYDKLQHIFNERGFKTITTGKNFLVLNVSKNEEMFEIACFRKEGMYEDGRRPNSVEVGDIFTDALRRDFTINSLFYHLSTKTLKDPTGDGIRDLIDVTLRFVGNPTTRIKEDHLRMFRYYRFIAKGFVPENRGLKTVRTLWGKYYKEVTPERAKTELEKMLGLI